MPIVQFAQSAQTDLLEAWLFIAEANQSAADRVLDTIEHEANILLTQPLMRRSRPELAAGIGCAADILWIGSVKFLPNCAIA